MREVINGGLKGRNLLVMLLVLSLIIITLFVSRENYIFFHSFLEMFTIIVGYCMGFIAANSYEYNKNSFFTFLALSFFFISTVDFMHTMVYSHNKANYNMYIQLAIISKTLKAVSSCIAFKVINKNINILKTIFIYILIVSSILYMVFYTKNFPTCFISSSGPTGFKILNDYISFGVYLYCTKLLRDNKSYFSKESYSDFKKFLIFSALSDVVYVIYIKNYDLSHIVGHLFKFLSYYMLYKATIKSILKDPYDSIFRKLIIKTQQMKNLNKVLEKNNMELNRAKDKLKRSKNKYKKFLDLLPQGILLIKDEKIVYANTCLVKILKYDSYSELMYKDICLLMKCSEEKEKLNVLSTMETEFVTKGGQTIHVEVTNDFIELEDKIYKLIVVRDILEKKQYERLKMELEEKDNLRVEFLANICHEIRTPINVIYSALQVEKIYIDKNNIEMINKYNGIMKQNCYRILRLCNNLIDTTKLEAGFVMAKMRRYNIVEVIENIVDSVVTYVNSRNLNIVFDTDTEEKYVMCDIEFIERIMLNLISNSIKFSKDCGEIFVSLSDKNDGIEINVKDNGVGIPESKQKAVFERFIQADKSFTRRNEGSGIGLSLVKSFVNLQGGDIKCKSKQGEGTEITIFFPSNEVLQKASCPNSLDYIKDSKIIEKMCVEFSDIY
ncbi:MASE3 domain-containing sensor histidine kinase [Clostridium rectalis]|uniref:sensor histidine kinase n=1 Tax=Clostridium rectalis TaxID=2040295 RepID=UPI000F631AC9|nr:MASE3 domain-containing protein [Clostridium rectalis]